MPQDLNHLPISYQLQALRPDARRAALADCEARVEATPDAATLAELTERYLDLSRPVEAEAAAHRLLAIVAADQGRDSRAYAEGLVHLAHALERQMQMAEAEPLLRRALQLFAAAGDDLGAANALWFLSFSLLGPERDAEELALRRRCLALRASHLDPDHPDVALAHLTVAHSLLTIGDVAQAEALSERALASQIRTFGNEHFSVADSLGLVAKIAMAQRKPAEAHGMLVRAMEITVALYGEAGTGFEVAAFQLASAKAAIGETAAALDWATRALSRRVDRLGDDHPMVGMGHNEVGVIASNTGQWDLAERHFRQAIDRIEPTPLAPSRLPNILLNLGDTFLSQGRLRSAHTLAEWAQIYPLTRVQVAHASRLLGFALVQMGAPNAALPHLHASLADYQSRDDSSPALVRSLHVAIAQASHSLGRTADVERHLTTAISILDECEDEPEELAGCLYLLADQFTKQRRDDRAVPLLRWGVALCDSGRVPVALDGYLRLALSKALLRTSR